MEDKQIPEYNPVTCEHKHANGFSAWSFHSEEQSNIGGANKVSIHVCLLCGEISIGGYRPAKDESHTNHFSETFNIYHAPAIDAIIKQANFYNEKEIWGRLHPSESAGVKGPVEMVQDLLDFMAECKGSNISPESRLISIENHLQKIVALAGSESPTAAGDGKEEKAFAEWLSENTEIIREEKITLYRYCDKMNEWGNYILDDIYQVYKNL